MMNCEEQVLKNVTEKDIEAIQSFLGRNPNQSELLLLACFNRERLRNRVYHETLDRLDVQARREIPEALFINDDLRIRIRTHSISADNKTETRDTTQADKVLLEEYIVDRNRQPATWKPKNVPYVIWRVKNKEFTNTGYGTSYLEEDSTESKPGPGDHWAIISVKEPTEKSRLTRLGTDVHQRPLDRDYLDSFLRMVRDAGLGIQVEQSILQPAAEGPGPAILLWYEGLNQARSQIRSFNPIIAGIFLDQQEIVCETDGIQVPVQALDFTSKSFIHGPSIPNPALASDWSFDDLEENPHWNQALIRLTQALRKSLPVIQTVRSGAHQKMGISRLKDEFLWVTAIPDNGYFVNIDPRTGGQLAVANAVRQLSCAGLKARFIGMNFYVPEPEDETVWRGLQLMEAVDSASRILGLQLIARQVNTVKNGLNLYCGVHAVTDVKRRFMNWGFKTEGDFISLLGSHRGELGGSLYLREIFGKSGGPVPVVDLSMETRIQDVVLQGIDSGLIRSAKPVGSGGLACAAVDSLLNGPDGLGARIHLSRKLRNDELLFGETQGLVMITLGENDIMEFERICMNAGVPSTTIGRVTATGRLTFNRLIDISVQELR